MSHSQDGLQWTEEIPRLRDLGGHGGMPGLEYLYCDSAHEFDAQQNAGWMRVERSPVLHLTGPTGSCPFVVMQRGEVVKGISVGPAQPLSISNHLSLATGLALPPTPQRSTTPAPPIQRKAEAAA